MHVARCSSAVKRTAIPWYPDCHPRSRATTGSTGSPLKPQTGSSCLLVKPKRSRRTGSLPCRESWTDPWCRRSTQVRKHTRATERKSQIRIRETDCISFSLQLRLISSTSLDAGCKPACVCVCAAGGMDWTMNSYILSNAAPRTERVQETAPSYLDLVLTARTLDCVADVNRADTEAYLSWMCNQRVPSAELLYKYGMWMFIALKPNI